MIYTLYNSTGEITGTLSVNNPADLAPYLRGGIQAVEGEIDSVAFKMDVTTAQAIAQPQSLEMAREAAHDALALKVAEYAGGAVATPYGSFSTFESDLAALTSAAVAAQGDPAFVVDWVDAEGAVVSMNKLAILGAQKAVVGYRAALAVARQILEHEIDAAVDVAAVDAVALTDIDSAMINQQSAQNQQGQSAIMASQQYIQGLAAAGIFYTPIATPRNADLSAGFFLIGDDISALPLIAQVSTLPGDPGTLLTVTAQVTNTQDRTWLDLVADAVISYVPRGMVPDETVKVNEIVISHPQAGIEALPQTAPVGENTQLHWDLKVVDDPVRILSSGEFTIVEGVTA